MRGGEIDFLCLAYNATRGGRILARTYRLLLCCQSRLAMLLKKKFGCANWFKIFALSGALWWDDMGVAGLLINAIVPQLIGADRGHVLVWEGGEARFDNLGTFFAGNWSERVLKLLEPTDDTHHKLDNRHFIHFFEGYDSIIDLSID